VRSWLENLVGLPPEKKIPVLLDWGGGGEGVWWCRNGCEARFGHDVEEINSK